MIHSENRSYILLAIEEKKRRKEKCPENHWSIFMHDPGQESHSSSKILNFFCRNDSFVDLLCTTHDMRGAPVRCSMQLLRNARVVFVDLHTSSRLLVYTCMP